MLTNQLTLFQACSSKHFIRSLCHNRGVLEKLIMVLE